MSLQERDALLSRLIGESWPFAPLLDEVVVLPEAHMLDLGGGEGGLLAELMRRGHTGRRELIDPSSGGDAHALTFPDASFDVVFMLRVLAHLHTPALALAEAWRVLAPGGRLVVAANGPRHLAGLFPERQSATCPFGSPGMHLRQLEVLLPVILNVADQQARSKSYGLSAEPYETLHSQIQLSGWVLTKEKRD